MFLCQKNLILVWTSGLKFQTSSKVDKEKRQNDVLNVSSLKKSQSRGNKMSSKVKNCKKGQIWMIFKRRKTIVQNKALILIISKIYQGQRIFFILRRRKMRDVIVIFINLSPRTRHDTYWIFVKLQPWLKRTVKRIFVNLALKAKRHTYWVFLILPSAKIEYFLPIYLLEQSGGHNEPL